MHSQQQTPHSRKQKMVKATLINKTNGKVVKEMTFGRLELLQDYWTKVMDHNYSRWSRGLRERLFLIVE
jgi:hypothetical protein